MFQDVVFEIKINTENMVIMPSTQWKYSQIWKAVQQQMVSDMISSESGYQFHILITLYSVITESSCAYLIWLILWSVGFSLQFCIIIRKRISISQLWLLRRHLNSMLYSRSYFRCVEFLCGCSLIFHLLFVLSNNVKSFFRA